MSQPQLPQPEGVDHRFVELPGLRIHVAEAGSGVPVLLLHGFPQHWWEWREVIPTLAEQFRMKEVLEQEGAFLESVPRATLEYFGTFFDRLLLDPTTGS